MATYNGNKRTTPARPAGGDEVCEGNLRGPTASAANDPPVVAIVSPAVGTPVAAGDALVFDVTDPDGDALELQRVLFQLGGPSGVWEQAYADGTACAGYAVERTAITDGYRYRVTRTAGWPGGGVRLEPVFADPTGRAGIND